MAVPYLPMPATVFLKNWQTQPLFWLFSLFSNTKFTENKFKLQQDSNSDHRNRRRARWPLDHHHGPLPVTVRSYFYTFIFVETNWMEEEEGKLPRMIALTFEFFLFFLFSVETEYSWRRRSSHPLHSGKGRAVSPVGLFRTHSVSHATAQRQLIFGSFFTPTDHYFLRKIWLCWTIPKCFQIKNVKTPNKPFGQQMETLYQKHGFFRMKLFYFGIPLKRF